MTSSGRRVKNNKKTKHIIKFLADSTDPQTNRLILNKSNNHVIRAICDAALNAQRGDVKLTPSKKQLFRKNHKTFERLTDPHTTIGSKRKFILQKGGALGLLPIILSTVLGSIGSALLRKVK